MVLKPVCRDSSEINHCPLPISFGKSRFKPYTVRYLLFMTMGSCEWVYKCIFLKAGRAWPLRRTWLKPSPRQLTQQECPPTLLLFLSSKCLPILGSSWRESGSQSRRRGQESGFLSKLLLRFSRNSARAHRSEASHLLSQRILSSILEVGKSTLSTYLTQVYLT